MQCDSTWRQHVRSVTNALLLLDCTSAAYGADTFSPSNRQLTIPSVVIGGANYTNMVVTVGNIVTAPSGTSANGSEDSYDPQTNLLTVQTVSVGSATYYNAVVSVASLVSCGGVSGADSYNGAELSISLVQVGATTYGDVVITVGSVVSVAGGMPTFVPDTYSSPNNQLAIPAVQVGDRVVTNVIITAGKLISVAGIYSSLQETALYSFGSQPAGSMDGTNPQAGLIQGSDGNLYGTTSTGGAGILSAGTVFKLTQGGVETVLYSFCSVSSPLCADGESPVAGVIQGTDGNFYGTTQRGGLGLGTVFKLTPDGVESVLYSFCGTPGAGSCAAGDGALPQAGLIQVGEALYGTTFQGGRYNEGTVFELTPAGVETVLHSFDGNYGYHGIADGVNPLAALILGSDGNLYGTTEFGGADNAGTVFQITLSGFEMQIHSFANSPEDGKFPKAALIQASDGNFYGTTNDGGSTGGGTVYRLNADNVETVLYSFNQASLSTDGNGPRGNLLQASDGNIYGTTTSGGVYDLGTILKITLDGVETVLHSFSAGNGATADGSSPEAGLLQDSSGNFYGTTYGGGANGNGTAFKMTNVINQR
jgi:uncharacterized repeat protein (TIGR03803 family)